jgi:hypothetical protein
VTAKPPKDLTYSVAKLELAAGDILVIRAKEPPNKAANDMLNRLAPPGVRILFIPPDVDMTVLTKADIEARIAPPAPVHVPWWRYIYRTDHP